ncbi:MAG: hypothetical protein MUP98_00545 [Candidatus Aminicenantes bacterium]|nr:hypothetical protein [Candidatus Aminicenantes bacterium]
MSRAAKSVFFFGIYVILLGVFLVLAPNVLLKFFNVPETSEVWIRVAGVLVLLIGYYYVRAATNEEGLTKFFRWTIYTRSSVIVFFTVFVLLNYVKPILILFGVFDLAGAIWTALALRSSDK